MYTRGFSGAYSLPYVAFIKSKIESFDFNLDELAKGGIVLSEAYSSYPVCSPFRAMLFSGRYPENNGVWNNCAPGRLDALREDLELIDFLQRHQHNLTKQNVTAKQQLKKLLLKANSFAQKELGSTAMEEQFKGSDRSSNSFTYEMIIGVSPSGEKGTISLFKHAALPKEIRNRFPEAASFSRKNPTYEELRKMIILLNSYIFWYQIQQQQCQFDLEDYIAEMNAMMTECGFSELYMGNPYDWMFMYCTLNERPLDVFRGLMLEVLEQE